MMQPSMDSAPFRVMVAVHVFYESIWPELLICVRNIHDAPDISAKVRITCPANHSGLVERLRRECPYAEIMPLEDRGWDVWPFIRSLDGLDLSDFDLVVKLHTKRDVEQWIAFRHFRGGDWRRELLSFCDTSAAVRRTIRAFRRESGLGMVAGRGVIDPSGVIAWRERNHGDAILVRCGLRPGRRICVYGTMFILRAALLAPVQGRFQAEEFDLLDENSEHGRYGLAGEWEAAFPLLVTAQGGRVGAGGARWTEEIRFHCAGVLLRMIRFLLNVVHRLVGEATYRRIADRALYRK